MFGQATAGVREGAGRVDRATGVSDRAREAAGQLTGRSPDELVAQIMELLANNKLGAGAALGGLGALILGTGAGRSLAGSAIKLGGLALIRRPRLQGLPELSAGTAAADGRQGRSAAGSARRAGWLRLRGRSRLPAIRHHAAAAAP